MAHFGPLPVFVNKVLLEHRQAQLYMHRLWQLSCDRDSLAHEAYPALYSGSAAVVCVDSDLRAICRDSRTNGQPNTVHVMHRAEGKQPAVLGSLNFLHIFRGMQLPSVDLRTPGFMIMKILLHQCSFSFRI